MGGGRGIERVEVDPDTVEIILAGTMDWCSRWWRRSCCRLVVPEVVEPLVAPLVPPAVPVVSLVVAVVEQAARRTASARFSVVRVMVAPARSGRKLA